MDIQHHNALKPVCVFEDGSYAFRARKRLYLIKENGRCESKYIHGSNEPADLLGEEKAEVFLRSHAHLQPQVQSEDHEIENELVIRVTVNPSSYEAVVGAVVAETNSTNVNRPVHLTVPNTGDSFGFIDRPLEKAADFLDTPIQAYRSGHLLGIAFPESEKN